MKRNNVIKGPKCSNFLKGKKEEKSLSGAKNSLEITFSRLRDYELVETLKILIIPKS